MAELIVTTFLSLDGVYQGPGGVEEDTSDGFDQGGWVTPFYEDDMAAYATEWLAQAGALLLGRRTYDIFVQYWPKATDEMATRMNSLPKYVASRTVSESDWSGVRFTEDVVDFVRDLKSRPGGEVQVHGSGDLLQTLIAHDLVDEYRLWLYPVVLGKGRKLFPEGVPPKAFEHVETRRTSAGVHVLVLRPAGKPKHDTFQLVRD